ncbi:MAG: MFS transporter [Candidatus Bathyarchaeia archaeon]
MQYSQLYITDLGADPIVLGSLNSIGSACSSVLTPLIGLMADRYSLRRVILLGLSFSVVISAIYSFAGDWTHLILAIILSGTVVVFPFADVIFISYTKAERRGTVMALSRAICGIPAIFTPMIAAVLVASFGGINASGIRPLYYLQMALSTVVLLFVASKLRSPRITQSEERLGLIQAFRELLGSEKLLRRWMLLESLRRCGMAIAMPFTPLWMVKVKGADPYILGVMGTVQTLISTLLQMPVGKLADRMGRKRAFYLLEPFNYLSTILLILAPEPQYLIPVGLLAGIGGVSFIPFITMYWEMVPAEKRGRWFGVSGIFSILSVPASILGGYLWERGYMIVVLLLPILMGAFLAIPILATIPETLRASRRERGGL